MTPEFYASLRLIILRDIARERAACGNPHWANVKHRQRDLARLRALRAGTATEL